MIQSVWKNLTGLQKAAEHLWRDFKWDTNSSPNNNSQYFKSKILDKKFSQGEQNSLLLKTFYKLLSPNFWLLVYIWFDDELN